jgi:hypothetical protein
MCYSGTEGFAWVAITQIVVVFMAMVILSARCAFHDLEILDPNECHVETSTELEEAGEDDTSVVNGIARWVESSFAPRKIPRTEPSVDDDGVELSEPWEEWEC